MIPISKILLFTISLIIYAPFAIKKQTINTTKPMIVIHGGAGHITRENLPPSEAEPYRKLMQQVLQQGYGMLQNGADADEVVTTCIQMLEDSPLFNAGKGSVFNHQGNIEMDAAIMQGHTLEAGAVAGVSAIKNPIMAARTIMKTSRHVLLSGKGAEDFAREHKLELADSSYFFTEKRYRQLQRIKDREQEDLDHSDDQGDAGSRDEKYGTVGCVVRDRQGHLAAGTSTGGLTNKKYGRIGDSPLIGAGTYANRTCAVSATGYGEFFIRTVAAHRVASLMEHKQLSPEQAGEQVLKQIKELGGAGGMIIIDHAGKVAMPFNTSGMFRGFINRQGKPEVQMYQ